MGAVILTNAQAANQLLGAIRRKLMELLFDGKPVAKENFTYAVSKRREANEKAMKDIEKRPDSAWLRSFAGTWTNAALGNVTIRVTDKEAIFDAGEWKSLLGRTTASDGAQSLVLLSCPFAGFEILTLDREGQTRLLIEVGQQKYEFVRGK